VRSIPATQPLEDLQKTLRTEREYDILSVSAGFDRHEEDWGGQLKTEDYFDIGKWVKESSTRHCNDSVSLKEGTIMRSSGKMCAVFFKD
jgi:acetoin utilization deacetylase AcuC-like enzyme